MKVRVGVKLVEIVDGAEQDVFAPSGIAIFPLNPVESTHQNFVLSVARGDDAANATAEGLQVVGVIPVAVRILVSAFTTKGSVQKSV